MSTTKTRVNISIPKDVRRSLEALAKRDQEPVATKASHLLQLAMEIEEDQVFDALAEGRDKRGSKFVSHKKAWA